MVFKLTPKTAFFYIQSVLYQMKTYNNDSQNPANVKKAVLFGLFYCLMKKGTNNSKLSVAQRRKVAAKSPESWT